MSFTNIRTGSLVITVIGLVLLLIYLPAASARDIGEEFENVRMQVSKHLYLYSNITMQNTLKSINGNGTQ